ncbi:MAG: hypothetical protein WCC04_14360 [Terriglobales bacterium]
MARNKSLLAVVGLAAIIVFGSQLQAQTIEAAIAGSSAQWQTLALGTFGGLQTGSTTQGNCGSLLGATAPCFHYTDGNSSGTSAFGLTDSRPSTPNSDLGAIWIVWDSSATPKVWAFIKVDSGVGNRCYFASPACNMGIASVPAPTGAIKAALWGTDTALPTAIANLFTTGTGIAVTVSATDIRPEDSLWSTCRTNSTAGTNAFDSTDGLGYNNNNAPGVCATYPAGPGGVGDAVKSGYPSSTSTANVLAWALTGKDPITGHTVPKYTTYSVGAAPVVFVFERNGGQLAGLTNVTDAQLQTAFSGAKCDADVFGLASNPIAVYLREPLSGTMNTTEASVFRYPVGGTDGKSQETGVNGANPLTGGIGGSVACPDDGSTGKGGRWRGIGTGEEVNSVANSVLDNGIDGIGYTFFSYGNVGALANSSKYGYATLDGVDGIFQFYNNTSGNGFDPGQPANGELPGTANLPTACAGAFPCAENQIWAHGLSFPNVRSGSYRAWSLLRVVSTGTALTNVEKVIKSSQSYVVTTTPDYIPAVKVTAGGIADPGLTLVRSHYQQVDGTGTTNIGGVPKNTSPDTGGDMGGCILTPATNAAKQLIQQGGTTSYACATRATNP